MSLRRFLFQICKPPRISEVLFAAVLVWLFATGDGWSVLLADGDTGWHIRNGEQILNTGQVPLADQFGFGTEGHPWYAWEWLADILFAVLFRSGGLRAVAIFSGIVIAAAVSILFRHILWRSTGMMLAIPVALLAVGASSIHYLARPHVLGLLFFTILCWLIDLDRASRSRWLTALPLLFIVWTNCHGSFLAGIAMLALWTAEAALLKSPLLRRRMLISAGCACATLCNPYGWRLHVHAIAYLQSSWIRAAVEEFQSPSFRSESIFQFEILLVCGLVSVPWLLRRKEYYGAVIIVFWAHESLVSVRHIALYCVAACPLLAVHLQCAWDSYSRSRPKSLLRTFDAINATWRRWDNGVTLWPVVLSLAIGFSSTHGLTPATPVEFPRNKFPVHLVERNVPVLRRDGVSAPRVFSSDQWSDYLIFRLYPAVRIYFDGRSDFFGAWRGKSYQSLMAGHSEATAILDDEHVEIALIPADWALAGVLGRDSRWRIADRDSMAVLFIRRYPNSADDPNQNLSIRR